MKFLLSLGWQLFVVWLALGIGSSLQVIDEVTVGVRDAYVCTSALAPMNDGHCRITAKAHGNFDGSWTFVAKNPIAKEFTLPAHTQKVYNPDAWHMKGGALGSYCLIIVALLLALIPVGLQYVTRRSKRS